MTENSQETSEVQEKPQDEFVRGLSDVYQRLKQGKHLKKAMKQVEQSLLDLLGVRLFTIYQSVDNGKEILASYKGGDPDDTSTTEIRVPFSPTSLAGYVALSQRALVIKMCSITKSCSTSIPDYNSIVVSPMLKVGP